LKGTKATIIARSSNLIATLDNDDVFDYMGGSALAIRQVNGSTPETVILNLADPKGGKHETLDKYMGREMRTRYTNPEWVKSMLNEGYGGARLIMTVTDNLWGWQVTVPEAVDGAKWQEMYETYVADRNQLGVKDKFREAKNLLAYQAMVDKMLVAINKGYWQADPKVKAHLDQVNHEVIAEAGVACNASSCSSPEITALAEAQDRRAMREAQAMPAPHPGQQSALMAGRSATAAANASAPTREASPSSPAGSAAGPAAPPASPAARAGQQSKTDAQVEGYEVQEQNTSSASLTAQQRHWALAAFGALVALGFFFRSRRRRW